MLRTQMQREAHEVFNVPIDIEDEAVATGGKIKVFTNEDTTMEDLPIEAIGGLLMSFKAISQG